MLNPQISEQFSALESTYTDLPPSSALPLLACETERRSVVTGFPPPDLVVYDRPVVGPALIREVAAADVVGMTTWFSNYESALLIAMTAKAENPSIRVVFGGPNATNLGERVLLNRPCVDYVVVGDGEDALWQLAAGLPDAEIPNLWRRDADGSPQRPAREEQVCLDTIAPFDFRHVHGLNLTRYDSRRAGYQDDPSMLPIVVPWTRGCPRASECGRGRCAYCSIPDHRWRAMSPEHAWRHAAHLNDTYGIKTFFEAGDDFFATDYPERLLACGSRLSDIRLRCYAGLWTVDERRVRAFGQLGVTEVFFGLETIDPTTNHWSGHEVTVDLARRALRLLKEQGISVCLPLMYGLPGESSKSLDANERMILGLAEEFENIRMVLVSIAVPLIGSRWFDELASDPFVQSAYGSDDLSTIDLPDYERLAEISVGKHCSVSFVEVVDAMERVSEQLGKHVQVGSFGGLGRRTRGSDART